MTVDLVAIAIDCPGEAASPYRLPSQLSAVTVGSGVEVPFGPRRVTGVVMDRWHGPEPTDYTIRDVSRRLDGVQLPTTLVALVAWAANYYHCSPGQFIAGTIPAVVREGRKPKPEVRFQAIGGASQRV